MTTQLTLLAWTLVLAVIQIGLAAISRTKDFGTRWNMGARDKDPGGLSVLSGRLLRAQANLLETLPLFAAAVLIANVTGRDGRLTLMGAELYFWARLVYLPLYAFGIPLVRSLVWIVSLAGLVLLLAAILLPH
jgi:uncharacterized MAPEG superfamily protein